MDPSERPSYNCPNSLLLSWSRRRGGAYQGALLFKDIISMPKVVIVNEKKEIDVPAGANLRQEARKAGVEVYPGISRILNCQGNGLCGTCKVLVKKGMENLSPRTLIEKFTMNTHFWTMLAAIGHEDELRLSCQAKVNGDCEIETKPAFNWSGENFWQKPYPNK
jgi:ferredoxin